VCSALSNATEKNHNAELGIMVIFTNDELHNALKFPWRQRGEQRDGITASRASAFFLSR
jgi:hypothetical protein